MPSEIVLDDCHLVAWQSMAVLYAGQLMKSPRSLTVYFLGRHWKVRNWRTDAGQGYWSMLGRGAGAPFPCSWQRCTTEPKWWPSLALRSVYLKHSGLNLIPRAVSNLDQWLFHNMYAYSSICACQRVKWTRVYMCVRISFWGVEQFARRNSWVERTISYGYTCLRHVKRTKMGEELRAGTCQ
jgi:hypothetical protein